MTILSIWFSLANQKQISTLYIIMPMLQRLEQRAHTGYLGKGKLISSCTFLILFCFQNSFYLAGTQLCSNIFLSFFFKHRHWGNCRRTLKYQGYTINFKDLNQLQEFYSVTKNGNRVTLFWVELLEIYNTIIAWRGFIQIARTICKKYLKRYRPRSSWKETS